MSDNRKQQKIYVYQCIEGPHVTTINLNFGFGVDSRREKLMAIEDLLLVVTNSHFHACGKGINHFSYHSSNNEWFLRHSCHFTKE